MTTDQPQTLPVAVIADMVSVMSDRARGEVAEQLAAAVADDQAANAEAAAKIALLESEVAAREERIASYQHMLRLLGSSPATDDSAVDTSNGHRTSGEPAAVVGAIETPAIAAASWPVGGRRAEPFHTRSNYGRVIGTLAAGVSRPKVIAEVLELREGTAIEALRVLEREGYVHRPDGPKRPYALLAKGKDAYQDLVARYGDAGAQSALADDRTLARKEASPPPEAAA